MVAIMHIRRQLLVTILAPFSNLVAYYLVALFLSRSHPTPAQKERDQHKCDRCPAEDNIIGGNPNYQKYHSQNQEHCRCFSFVLIIHFRIFTS